MTKECECAAHSAAECVCGAWDEPPQRTWVGLDDDEVREIYGIDLDYKDGDYARYARAIEAKLKEKNT